MSQTLLCSFCCYRSNSRLDLIKHSFASHSVEPTFHLVCGVRSCLYSFGPGSTFESFKTHARRKHPRWQDSINEPAAQMNVFEPPPQNQSLTIVPPTSVQTLTPLDVSDDITSLDRASPSTQVQKSPSPNHRAALFLLTFKERYRLSQKAIDYAVGSINAIVDSVCASVRDSLHHSLPTTSAELVRCFDYDDPFHALQTEYQQTKFYRLEFGLVVSA